MPKKMSKKTTSERLEARRNASQAKSKNLAKVRDYVDEGLMSSIEAAEWIRTIDGVRSLVGQNETFHCLMSVVSRRRRDEIAALEARNAEAQRQRAVKKAVAARI